MADETNKLMAEIADSGLFDAEWYLTHNPDVAAAQLDALVHFARHGLTEGRQPNEWFDPEWYLHEYPDVSTSGLPALLHYLRWGAAENRKPSPWFDPVWYAKCHRLAAEGLPLRHFLENRRDGASAPHPDLWPVPYIRPYDADAAEGCDPYSHFLRDTNGAPDPAPEVAIIAASGLVDANFYLITGTDVHEAGLDPTLHFCRFGWRERRKPNIYFDVSWYLDTNPEVVRLGINPLLHYIVEGEEADRRPVPYFDPDWYRTTYQVSGETALAHYLRRRRSQTVSPNPMFDVAWYVAQHEEELGPNRDAFAHYLHAGTLADIAPCPGFDAAEYRRRHMGRPSRAFRQLVQPDRDNPLVHYLRSQYR